MMDTIAVIQRSNQFTNASEPLFPLLLALRVAYYIHTVCACREQGNKGEGRAQQFGQWPCVCERGRNKRDTSKYKIDGTEEEEKEKKWTYKGGIIKGAE